MTMKGIHHHNKPNLVLDLHGCRKDDAIAKVTRFLNDIRYPITSSNITNARSNTVEKNKGIMVTIITGSGKHSSQGPILRQAVQALLKKRLMEYTINPGKGSFTVNAISGIDLYGDPLQKEDTKVIIQPRSQNDNDLSIKLIGRSSKLLHQQRSSSSSSSLLLDHPLPHEVAQDDKLIQSIKLKSATEARNIQNQKTKQEQSQLEHAKLLSMESYNDNILKEEQELKHVLSVSEHEFVEQRKLLENDEELNHVLDLSKQETQQQQQEDEELNKVLELSKVNIHFTHNSTIDSEKEEEEELKKIMELSKQMADEESLQNELFWKEVYRENNDSNNNCINFDESEIHKAIQESLSIHNINN